MVSRSCAAAALATAASPEPPVIAPVRKSEINGRKARMHGNAGCIMLTSTSPASDSASPWARAPASAAGLVRPGLCRRTDLQRHAPPHAFTHDAAGFLGQSQRRHHMADRGEAERLRAKPSFTCKSGIEHVDHRRHVGRLEKAGADGFRRRFQCRKRTVLTSSINGSARSRATTGRSE